MVKRQSFKLWLRGRRDFYETAWGWPTRGDLGGTLGGGKCKKQPGAGQPRGTHLGGELLGEDSQIQETAWGWPTRGSLRGCLGDPEYKKQPGAGHPGGGDALGGIFLGRIPERKPEGQPKAEKRQNWYPKKPPRRQFSVAQTLET